MDDEPEEQTERSQQDKPDDRTRQRRSMRFFVRRRKLVVRTNTLRRRLWLHDIFLHQLRSCSAGNAGISRRQDR